MAREAGPTMAREAELWEDLTLSSSASPSISSADMSPVGLSKAPRRRSSFSYYQLPDPNLRLTILRLDNTSFGVKIGRNAMVMGLKTAVEDVFRDRSEMADGGGNISWSHVWGHFCLCYKDYKLVDDRRSLREYGIKDGDQLRFVRHVSINHIPEKERNRSHKEIKRSVTLSKGREVKTKDMINNHGSNRLEFGEDLMYDSDENLLDKSERKSRELWRGLISCTGRRNSVEFGRHRRSRSYF